jgi:hypothetical protein
VTGHVKGEDDVKERVQDMTFTTSPPAELWLTVKRMFVMCGKSACQKKPPHSVHMADKKIILTAIYWSKRPVPWLMTNLNNTTQRTACHTWNTLCKGHPITCQTGTEGEKRHSSTLSSTWTLDRGGWSTPRPGCFTPGKETRYQLYRRMGGPQGRPVRVRKNLFPLGIRNPDHPASSKSLYRLSYACPPNGSVKRPRYSETEDPE